MTRNNRAEHRKDLVATVDNLDKLCNQCSVMRSKICSVSVEMAKYLGVELKCQGGATEISVLVELIGALSIPNNAQEMITSYLQLVSSYSVACQSLNQLMHGIQEELQEAVGLTGENVDSD